MIKNATKQGYLLAYDGDGIDLENGTRKGRRGTVQSGIIQTLNTQDTKGVVVSETYVEKQINKALEKDKETEFVDIYNANPIKDTSITITTSTGSLGGCGSKGIIESNLKQELCNKLIEEGKVEEGDVIRHSYSNSRLENFYTQNQSENNVAPTLDTRAVCLGVAVKDKPIQEYGTYYTWENNKGELNTQCNKANNPENAALTVACANTGNVLDKTQLRIRKLTPKECFRLMGLKDQDSDKIAQSQSNASQYHLAGDSIVVQVLMALFGELLNIEWEEKVRETIEEIKEQ